MACFVPSGLHFVTVRGLLNLTPMQSDFNRLPLHVSSVEFVTFFSILDLRHMLTIFVETGILVPYHDG